MGLCSEAERPSVPPSFPSLHLIRRSQNFRYSVNVTYFPIRHWESGDRMAPLTQHSPSTD
eukprot:6181133-Pleurochrysis_carterae.AAC.2